MKYFKLLTVALLGVFASTSLASAQTADPANDPNNIGRAKAYLTRGVVQKSLAATPETWTTIARGADFLPGDSIKTGADGNCMLVFSNGAAMQVKPNSTVTITQYEQAPFNQSTQGTFLRLQSDPSKSTTRLDLKEGSLAGEVKKLNVNQGSSFNINTPAGSAGIRGTMISISVTINGRTFTVNAQCVEGVMTFTPRATPENPNPNNLNIPAGAEGTVSIDIAADATGTLSNLSVNGQAMSTDQSSATITALVNLINETIQEYNDANPGNTIPPITPPPVPDPTDPTQTPNTPGGTTSSTPSTDQPNTNPTLVSQ